MGYKEFHFPSCTGLDLFARSWELDWKKTRANFFFVHGLGEHSGRYGELAEFLLKAGFQCYTFDYLGFGKSPGKRGHIKSFDIYFEDFRAFIKMIEGEKKESPTFLLGHSLGGLLGLTFALKYPGAVDGYVITSPALKNQPIPLLLRKVVEICSKVVPGLTFKNNLDVSKLSHNPEVVKRYVDDPLVHGKITPRFFAEISRAMNYVQSHAGEFSDPLFLMYAGADGIVDPLGSADFAAQLPDELDHQVVCLENLYHEVYKEYEKEMVMQRVVDWVEDQLTKFDF